MEQAAFECICDHFILSYVSNQICLLLSDESLQILLIKLIQNVAKLHTWWKSLPLLLPSPLKSTWEKRHLKRCRSASGPYCSTSWTTNITSIPHWVLSSSHHYCYQCHKTPYRPKHRSFFNSQQVWQCQNVSTTGCTVHFSLFLQQIYIFWGLMQTAWSAVNLYNRSSIIVQLTL